MESSKPKLQKGDRVFVEGTNGRCRKNQYATVESVGRKYFKLADFARGRFYVETWGQVSEYMSEYRLWASEEEYLMQKRKTELWKKLRSFADSYKFPEDLTIDRIEEALRILGVEIDEEQ